MTSSSEGGVSRDSNASRVEVDAKLNRHSMVYRIKRGTSETARTSDGMGVLAVKAKVCVSLYGR